MREPRKSQLTSLSILFGIGLLSFLLLIAMNFLAWPVGSEVGKIATYTPSPEKVSYGVLVVTILSNQTLVPGPVAVNNNASYLVLPTEPLSGVPIGISLNSLTPFVTNRTNGNGQIQENIPPDLYSVKISDWRLNNFTVSVTIYSNQVTALTVTLNATSYGVQEFNIFDPDSTGFVVGWEQVFARLSSSQSVVAQSPLTFLDTDLPAATPIGSIEQRMVTPISIASVELGNQSQWVQLQVKAPLNIGNIKSMSLLTLKTTYSVNTSAI